MDSHNVIEIKMPYHISQRNNKDKLIVSFCKDMHLVFNKGKGYASHKTINIWDKKFDFDTEDFNIDFKVKIGDTDCMILIEKLIIKDSTIVLNFLVNSAYSKAFVKLYEEHYESNKIRKYSFPVVSYINYNGKRNIAYDYNLNMLTFKNKDKK